MKNFYQAFQQIKVQHKHISKDFLLCYLFKILAKKTLVNLVTVKVHDSSKAFNNIVVVTYN